MENDPPEAISVIWTILGDLLVPNVVLRIIPHPKMGILTPFAKVNFPEISKDEPLYREYAYNVENLIEYLSHHTLVPWRER